MLISFFNLLVFEILLISFLIAFLFFSFLFLILLHFYYFIHSTTGVCDVITCFPVQSEFVCFSPFGPLCCSLIKEHGSGSLTNPPFIDLPFQPLV